MKQPKMKTISNPPSQSWVFHLVVAVCMYEIALVVYGKERRLLQKINLGHYLVWRLLLISVL